MTVFSYDFTTITIVLSLEGSINKIKEFFTDFRLTPADRVSILFSVLIVRL